MAGSEGIQYKELRLSTTRVIDLLPGVDLAPIHCRLRHIDLNDPPAYEAISYVCGDTNDTISIGCDESRVDIYRTLHKALCRFRLPDTHRTLWADCICINQDDLQERSRQVLLMADIYSKAAKVLIWLGDENEGEDTHFALWCINLIHLRIWPRLKELEAFRENALMFNEEVEAQGLHYFSYASKRNVEAISAKFAIPLPDSKEFTSLGRFWNRAWFHRAWTFQESHLAKRKSFYCGRWEIPWILLVRVLTSLSLLHGSTDDIRYYSTEAGSVLTMISTDSFLTKREHVYNTFLALLELRRGSGCTVRGDHIYSLLGSTADCPSIVSDYTKPFQQVFTEVTFQVILQSKNFTILGCIDTDHGDSSLPSWVPDWRQRRPYDLNLTSVDGRRYNCSGSSKPVVKLCADGKKLSVTGILWDHIATMGDFVSLNNLEAQIGEVYYPTKESTFGAWMQTFCTDLALYQSKATRWTASFTASIRSAVPLADDDQASAEGAFLRNRQAHQTHRVSIITKKGRLGLAPEQARVHDVIAIALGGEVPVVLRPCADGTYKFVGECYIHGFMDGEALIDEWKNTKPDADHSDTGWLEHLHETPVPFDTQVFTLT